MNIIFSKYIISTKHLFKLIFTSIIFCWVFSYLSTAFSFLIGISYGLALIMMFCLIFTKEINQSYTGSFLIIYTLLILLVFFISRVYYLTSSFSAITMILNLWLGLGLFIYGAYFKLIKNIHILFCFYIIISILILDIAPANVMKNSYNHISIVSIGLLVISNLKYNPHDRNLFLFQIYLTLVVCLISIGRSGILSSFFLTIISSIYFINNSKISTGKKRALRFTFLISIIIATILFLNTSYAIRFIASSINLSGRDVIFSNYFSLMGVREFFLGHDIFFTREVIDPSLSIHNSYLGIHQSAGILGLGLLIIMIFTAPLLFKKNFIYFLLYSTILLRAFTDNIIYTSGFIYGSLATVFMLSAFIRFKNDKM